MNLDHASSPEQREQMEEISRMGICPFCREHFEANHKAPILYESNHWLVTKNDYAYKGAQLHLLLVFKEHVLTPSQIPIEGWMELTRIFSWIEQEFKMPGGVFFMRFGDMNYTGATIEHLHAHVIFGESNKTGNTDLLVKVGYAKT